MADSVGDDRYAQWVEPARAAAAEDAARFLRESVAPGRVRELAESGGGLDRKQVQRACAAGYLLPFAGDVPLAGAAILAEQWGRALGPEPLAEMNVVVDSLRRLGSPRLQREVLPGLLTGERVATWAAEDLPGYWGTGPGVRARSVAGGYHLSGSAGLVQHAEDADWLLVAARDGDGVSQFLVPLDAVGLRIVRVTALDLTRPRYQLSLEGVAVTADALVGARGGGTRDLGRQVSVALVLALAQTVGSMGRLFELALAHAKTRTAFGRPIGSFQAVKHMMVDASLALETSRAMCDAATEAADAAREDAGEVLSMAKAFVAKAGIDLAHTAWQVFGGIAYMWQNDFHLYLRRITSDAALYGTAAWHNEHICALHRLGEPDAAPARTGRSGQ